MNIETIRQHKPSSDRLVVGSAAHPGDDWFIDGHDTYTWYTAIGYLVKPDRVLELGVRYGYAAIAILKGALAARTFHPDYVGIDSEADGIESNQIAIQSILRECPEVEGTIWRMDTSLEQTRDNVIMDTGARGRFNIVHVDGNHSPEGAAAEMQIAGIATYWKGVILVDDIDCPHVKGIADIFCEMRGIVPLHIPTFHGMYLIDMRK